MTMLVSRRRAMKIAGTIGLAAAGTGLAGLACAEQVTQKVAKYRAAPNGIQRCEICLQFRPPNRCNLVEGEISPKGWCQYFAAKENAS
jgi:hypothetical protein